MIIVAITEMCWDVSDDKGATIIDYKHFRRDRQGRRDDGMVLYVRECFYCVQVNDGDNRIECL